MPKALVQGGLRDTEEAEAPSEAKRFIRVIPRGDRGDIDVEADRALLTAMELTLIKGDVPVGCFNRNDVIGWYVVTEDEDGVRY